MDWKIEFSQEAIKQLNRLDKPVRERIFNWLIDRLDNCNNPRHFGEPLSANLSGLWRYRIGDYRVICQIDDTKIIVIVLNIGHRRDIYKK